MQYPALCFGHGRTLAGSSGAGKGENRLCGTRRRYHGEDLSTLPGRLSCCRYLSSLSHSPSNTIREEATTSVLKKIWHDPVWSKVIAAILVAALSAVAALVWKSSVGALLLRTSPVPNWVLGLLGLIVVSESVILLATGYTRRQLSGPAMRAHFTAPPNGAKVPRKAFLSGTIENIPAGIDVWLVVENGAVYHPQGAQLPTDSGAFHRAPVTIGSVNSGHLHEFTIHVLAVTKSISRSFSRYQQDSASSKKWPGVRKPADSMVLATLKVIRDDSASI